jgi:hypothetical protein
MTDPGPDPAAALAALAAQLEELRGQLARSQGEVGQLRARMEEFSGRDMVMLRAIKQLGEKLDEAVRKRAADDPQAPVWIRLDEEERAARLAVLRDWVEKFARPQYPKYLAKLPSCWESHPEAVWELSNLMTEWVRVYADPENRPLQDALWWHERWLPGVLNRLAQAYNCDAAGCRAARSSPWERSPPRYS